MSILIKGMDMPKPNSMFTATIRVRQDCTAEIITAFDENVKSFELKEVPTPHGRLIDDFKTLRAIIKAFPNKSMDFHIKLEETIDDIKTIIEAEGSE